ncbi:MAG: PKD domain-containing protein [Ferruginibacter sp.]
MMRRIMHRLLVAVRLQAKTDAKRLMNSRCCLLALLLYAAGVHAQCPPNIDFESGNFTGWQCYKGTFANGNLLLSPSQPTPGRHTMLSTVAGDGLDFWGGFPKNCPNGSGHSIQLGNDQSGGQAEGISYTFTIPAGQNKFSLIYSYAIVLMDFGHPPNLQPRLSIEVNDLTTTSPVPCAGLNFVIDGTLPGFMVSPESSPTIPIRYKNWSSQSVNLDNLAGHTIQISFTTTDCGQQAHFGYAYIDVNSDCNSSFFGSSFCPLDTLVNLTAPFGYQQYTWYNSANQIIGNQQVLSFKPPPPSGTVVSVELVPYNGYGCTQVLTTTLTADLSITADAGIDKRTCDNKPVQIGSIPKPGLKYQWTPVTGLSDPNIANPILTPTAVTNTSLVYSLRVSNEGGGCVANDDVTVDVTFLRDSIQLVGPAAICDPDAALSYLKVLPADFILWYRNDIEIPGENGQELHNLETGDYYAMLYADGGCSMKTKMIHIERYKASFIVPATLQCFKNNRFSFTNNSYAPPGGATYLWNFGDGNQSNAADATHAYLAPGVYTVKLTMQSATCTDDTTILVTVQDGPIAAFSVNNYGQCLPGNQFIMQNNSTVSSGTLNYLWSFGDGITDNVKDPVHTYGNYGKYSIKLLVSAGGVCQDSISKDVDVFLVPEPDFAVQPVCQNLRVPVINRTSNITNAAVSYIWDFGDGHTDNVYTPVYSYPVPGDYTITLSASIPQCPAILNSISKTITIERTIPGITYPVKDAAFNFNEQLQARNIGSSVVWSPATSLDNRFSYQPVFRGLTEQLYTIQLKTAAGCITVDTQLVKTHKKINIYVPSAFTPGNDNKNEYLKPALVGFVKLNYFRIYDRWGKLLFSSSSEFPGWDGKINGITADMQTVVWMIEAVDVDGAVHKQQGTTVLIR